MTAFMVIAVVMLMVSMTRRIRRVRYQAQIRLPGQDSPGGADTNLAVAGEPQASKHTT
ncbi:hypothetical protein PV772_09655 [Pseudarthrobacter sp. CC12]|uniref:hypothetical protein n=1 Tax=Pseudarthrobacter sp. CC12 TaxID=3029193 RepID=UPI003265B286